jgi:hypothetical protein
MLSTTFILALMIYFVENALKLICMRLLCQKNFVEVILPEPVKQEGRGNRKEGEEGGGREGVGGGEHRERKVIS